MARHRREREAGCEEGGSTALWLALWKDGGKHEEGGHYRGIHGSRAKREQAARRIRTKTRSQNAEKEICRLERRTGRQKRQEGKRGRMRNRKQGMPERIR